MPTMKAGMWTVRFIDDDSRTPAQAALCVLLGADSGAWLLSRGEARELARLLLEAADR